MRLHLFLAPCLLSAGILSGSASAQDNPRLPSMPDATPATEPAPTTLAGIDNNRIRPWGGLSYTTGPGIGYHEACSAFEGFIPLYQNNASLVFSDLRGLL